MIGFITKMRYMLSKQYWIHHKVWKFPWICKSKCHCRHKLRLGNPWNSVVQQISEWYQILHILPSDYVRSISGNWQLTIGVTYPSSPTSLMILPSPGGLPSWSPHFQSAPRQILVPIFMSKASSGPDKFALLQFCFKSRECIFHFHFL